MPGFSTTAWRIGRHRGFGMMICSSDTGLVNVVAMPYSTAMTITTAA